MNDEDIFARFKELCGEEGLLDHQDSIERHDIVTGISDDGALRRFLRARGYDVEGALQQYRSTRKWRIENQLLQLYESIEVSDYEETRKLYTHWTGRRDRNGSPICLFEVRQLTPSVMAAHNESCTKIRQSSHTESESMLRLFCTYENLIRFVLPLCSSIKSLDDPTVPDDAITSTTCIVDVAGVSLMQFWRLRNHMQAASTLATAYYPETLGKTYVIGAPSFFPTIWGWLNKWFNQNTVSKIHIVPAGEELAVLSKMIDPSNIPDKYGGTFRFDFGMAPDLDDAIRRTVQWEVDPTLPGHAHMPLGPMLWTRPKDGSKSALTVGTSNGFQRHDKVWDLHSNSRRVNDSEIRQQL